MTEVDFWMGIYTLVMALWAWGIAADEMSYGLIWGLWLWTASPCFYWIWKMVF